MLKRIFFFFSITFFICFLTACDIQPNADSPSVDVKEEAVLPNEIKMEPSRLVVLDKSLEIFSTVDEFDNIIEYSRRKNDFAKQGTYVLSSKKGKILEIAQYENDTLHGNRILFYAEAGDTQIVETYHHGKFEGPYRVFYPNGKLEQLGTFNANMMEGKWVRFYETGEPMEEVIFMENNENGPFKEYHLNGNIKAEGYYKNGDNEHGALKLYNEEGELIKTMNCVKGICKTIWKKELDN